MVRHTDEGEFAEPYEEHRVEVDEDDLTHSRFRGLTLVDDSRRKSSGKTAIEFEYTTRHGNPKVVRALQATSASSFDRDRFPESADLDGVEAYTFHDDGDGYAYTDDGRMWSYGDDRTYRVVGDVDAVYRVDLPESAPVTGAVQDGVSVTVQYRSNRSGNMKTIRLDDVDVDWEGDRVRGYHARRDRTVEVEAVYERSVVSKSYSGGDREVGKCARIEFPAGHTYTVDVEGVADDEVDDVAGVLKQSLASDLEAITDNDVAVGVTHDGRIDD